MVPIQQFAGSIAKCTVPGRASLRGTAYHKGVIDLFNAQIVLEQIAHFDYPVEIAGVLVFPFEYDQNLRSQFPFAHSRPAHTMQLLGTAPAIRNSILQSDDTPDILFPQPISQILNLPTPGISSVCR
jgi:hypothetical protein